MVSPGPVIDLRARYRGALLGLAVGDALGTTLEFSAPGSFSPIDSVVGGGPFGLSPGQWTDDTSMALCLAESLVERGAHDPVDQLQRYVRWYRTGHRSSTGRCFDIGGTVRHALERYERTGEPYPGPTDPLSAGNGSLMRLAPVAMAYRRDADAAIARAGDTSRTTHGATEAVDACRLYSALLVGALNGVPKEQLLTPDWIAHAVGGAAMVLAPAVAAIAAGSFREKQPPAIRGTGYVVASLEASLWAVEGAASFREAGLRAVNLGDDADTTGAIAGQLAGALWGVGGPVGIPPAWLHTLAQRAEITELADELLALSERLA